MLVCLARIAALPIIRAKRGLPRSCLDTTMVVAAMATTVFLIFQSEWKAWASLAVAAAVGFAIRLVASRSISTVARQVYSADVTGVAPR